MRIDPLLSRPVCIAAVLLGLTATACSFAPPAERLPDMADLDRSAKCRVLQEQIAAAVERSGTGDAEATVVAGQPFLRTNRFLASFADADLDDAALRTWGDRMRDLADESLSVEFGNLGAVTKQRLNAVSADAFGMSALDAMTECGARSVTGLLASRSGISRLRNSVSVPDHYDDAVRVVGLYPLTALPVAIGYDRWRTANLALFTRPSASLPETGKRIAYQPKESAGALPASEVRAILERAQINPLKIPEPTPDDALRLLRAFAPIWFVDTIGPDDQPGKLAWQASQTLSVESDRLATYWKLTWTRFGDDILLQLNYLVWFPARTKTGPLDLLGGELDGVVWRVTLGADGRPLIFDSMHACGCYHLFFPVPPLVPAPGPPDHDIRERAETPAKGPEIMPGQQVAIWLAGISHYVQAVSVEDSSDAKIDARKSYTLASADDLRRLPLTEGGTRSIYGPDGIVAGTERLERFLLWPMGIASPGAMRQWGTHATAFIGRRHFDDPYLFDTAFRDPRRQ